MNSFSVRTDRIRINAPVDFVWEVLTENVDLLSSVLSPIVSLLFGGYMRRGFGDVGVALRLRAETLYRETKNLKIRRSTLSVSVSDCTAALKQRKIH